jgi:hypothetical protein
MLFVLKLRRPSHKESAQQNALIVWIALVSDSFGGIEL